VAAVQFALFMATVNLGYVVGAPVTGLVLESLTDVQALLLVAVFPVAAALLVGRVDLAGHRARVGALAAVEFAPSPDAAPVAAALQVPPAERGVPV
jgi:hypothetical protein